jgi:sodium-independent sulfate anion transporter 11
MNFVGLHNPSIVVESLVPGVLVFRLEESFTYPNAALVTNIVVDYAKEHTRRGKDITLTRLIDRPWNDSGPRRGAKDHAAEDLQKPLLRALVLDFAAVSNADTTSVQNLIDTRKELERWADGPVEFHFANILKPWVRRALIAGGFGTGEDTSPLEVAPVAPTGGEDNADPRLDWKWESRSKAPQDIEEASHEDKYNGKGRATGSAEGPLISTSTPFFHVDLDAAVKAAETGAKRHNANEPAHQQ